jgi:hypothetical protein
MNNKQRETFKMLCDTLREAVRYDLEDNGENYVIADQAVKDNIELIRIMLRDSGFIIPEDFSVGDMCKMFRSCLLCCDQCESCAEWVEAEGLTGFAACCYDNVVGYGLAVKHETPKEEEKEPLETDNTIEPDPYKIIESYKKVIKDTLDDLYEELNYTTYAKLAERLRKNDLWK